MSVTQTQKEPIWTLHHDRQETAVVRFRPRLVSNDIATIYQAVAGGLGIGLLPEFLFQMEQRDCQLVNILPQWSSTPVPINAVYCSHKYMPQKVKVFLDFLGMSINANSVNLGRSLRSM
jgi:LysR family transcriptional regulator, regulator for bpeEF and oprC